MATDGKRECANLAVFLLQGTVDILQSVINWFIWRHFRPWRCFIVTLCVIQFTKYLQNRAEPRGLADTLRDQILDETQFKKV